MMTLMPSLAYLTKYLKKNYDLFSDSLDIISKEENLSSKEYTDREKGILIFENFVSDNFFVKKDHLQEFLFSLHEEVQKKILTDLGKSKISDIVWDKRVSEYFVEEFQFKKKFLVKEEEPIEKESYRRINKLPTTFKKLKEYQASVFFKVNKYLTNVPCARCIIQMPTGSGKTRTAMEVVIEIMNETGKDVLWLANTEELCDQAYEAFIDTCQFIGRRDIQVINHMISSDEIETDVPCFHIASIQSLLNKTEKEIESRIQTTASKLELLVIDEAHISVANQYEKVISYFIMENVKLVGLTATPGRELSSNSKIDQNDKLSKFFNNKKFEIEMTGAEPLTYLRDEGILSYTHFESIEGSYIRESLKGDKPKLSDAGLLKRIESVLTQNVSRNMVIFKQLSKLLEEGKKILFFATSVVHSKLMNTLLEYKGFKTAHLDGNTGEERSRIISSFKKGEIQILCNYGILSTGFDDPKIDVVFIARPTNSIVLYSQMIGRGLRGPLIGGTDKCEIFTVFDNIFDLPGNDQIYSYFDKYFEN